MPRKMIFWLALALGLAMLAPGLAAALSVDQVIALRKAGVSDATIQAMIRREMEVRRQGGVGRYVVRDSADSEVIVYQASSARGEVDYPLGPETSAQGVDPVAAVLGASRRQAPPASASTKARPAAQSKAKSKAKSSPKAPGGYTLHLASFRGEANAQRLVRELAAKKVSARVAQVDLGPKGRWHRVLVGGFASRAQAQAQGQKLRQAGTIAKFTVIPGGKFSAVAQGK